MYLVKIVSCLSSLCLLLIENKMSEEIEKMLHDIYYNIQNPASFGGINRLTQAINQATDKVVSKRDIEFFLKSSETYTTHRERRKKFDRRPMKAHAVDDIWQADLVIMSPDLTKYNDGYTNIL